MRKQIVGVTAVAGLLLGACASHPSQARLCLAHPDPAERLAAIAILDRTPDPDARPALLRTALADPEPRVQQAAALTLEAQTGESLEGLALAALNRSGDLEVARWVIRSDREGLRWAGVKALARIGSEEACSLLAGRLSGDPSPGVRLFCARSLVVAVTQGPGRAYGDILAAFRKGVGDSSPEVRQVCARALAAGGDPVGVPLLIQALGTDKIGEKDALLGLLRTATGEDLGKEVGPWQARYGSVGSP